MAVDDDGSLELDLLASSLRADVSDLGAFVEGLAAKLEGAVPGLVRVERARAGMFGPKNIKKITVSAGGDRLELVCDGGRDRVQTQRCRVSGGITLKTEPLDIDTWLASLTQALSAEAAQSQQTRQARERLLLD
jgi:hypothetical protein